MDLFDTPWLISMLKKSSKTPQGRLLSLFDILDDWLKAPQIGQVTVSLGTSNPLLLNYCIQQAQELGADAPDMLAEHIILIAQNAARHAISQPESNSLLHAKKVATALIQAQTQRTGVLTRMRQSRPAIYATAASIIIAIAGAALWVPSIIDNHLNQARLAGNKQQIESTLTAQTSPGKALTAIDASRMYAKYEQMRQGTCQFPEALQIPDKHKSIYLENVVGGKLPTDLADLEIANYYLEKVRCNFTPMLMAASK